MRLCGRLGRTGQQSHVKRVSNSAFHSDPRNIQSGKASLIEHLFGTMGAEDEVREGMKGDEKVHEKEKA